MKNGNVTTGPWNIKNPPDGSVDAGRIQLDDDEMSTPTKDEMKFALEASEARVDARLAQFDTSVKTGFAELRTDFAKMQADMHKNTVDLIKWGLGVGISLVVVTISILTFVVKTAADKPSSPTTQAQASPAPPAPPAVSAPAPKN